MIDYLSIYRLIKDFSTPTTEAVVAAVPTSSSSNDIPEIAKLQASRLYTNKKFCDCPSSEKGIIQIDVSAHEPDCKLRKRVNTRGYTTDTSVVPEDFKDGYGLGVAP